MNIIYSKILSLILLIILIIFLYNSSLIEALPPSSERPKPMKEAVTESGLRTPLIKSKQQQYNPANLRRINVSPSKLYKYNIYAREKPHHNLVSNKRFPIIKDEINVVSNLDLEKNENISKMQDNPTFFQKVLWGIRYHNILNLIDEIISHPRQPYSHSLTDRIIDVVEDPDVTLPPKIIDKVLDDWGGGPLKPGKPSHLSPPLSPPPPPRLKKPNKPIPPYDPSPADEESEIVSSSRKPIYKYFYKYPDE